MDKIKTGTQNSTESEELKQVAQAETPTELVKSIDNATESQKNIDETEAKTETSKTEETMAVISYIGNGVWKDSNGALWANTDKTPNIVRERKYGIDEYNEREDLKFMVGYGAMRVTFV